MSRRRLRWWSRFSQSSSRQDLDVWVKPRGPGIPGRPIGLGVERNLYIQEKVEVVKQVLTMKV